jgi:hypothetical protein
MTYTELLRHLHEAELLRDSIQESQAISLQEYKNQKLSTLKTCLGHVNTAEALIEIGYDIERNKRIILAQKHVIQSCIDYFTSCNENVAQLIPSQTAKKLNLTITQGLS